MGSVHRGATQKAPTLLRLLSTIVQHNDHRNTSKRGDRHNPGISMAMAVLLKERNREMCGLQSLIVLLLFKGQAHKKASECVVGCIGVDKPVCVVVNLNPADINHYVHVGITHY